MTSDPDCLRTGEASLAEASCPVPHDHDCEFALDRTTVDQWEITIRSARADAWVRKELCQPFSCCLSGSIITDVISADRFIKSAQARGFRFKFMSQAELSSRSQHRAKRIRPL